MPGRDTIFKTGYRYGFNGKEMDNQPYGQGNEYDYGMRIYNPRIGKFLSVDPYSKKYPYYSPYLFAGDGPIANKDADGGEPQSYTSDYKYPPMFDLSTNQRLAENNGYGKEVKDPTLGWVNVYLVYDNVTKQDWIVHDDDQGNYYYLKNDNGQNDILTLKGGTISIKGGHLEPYKTYDQVAYEQTDALLKSIATGTAGAVTAPFIFAAAPEAGSAGWAVWSDPYVLAFLSGDLAAAYGYEAENAQAMMQEEATPTSSTSSTNPVNTKAEPEPLDWSRVNHKGETAEEHVSLHGQNDIQKKSTNGLHGVFYGDPVQTTNEA